MNAELGKRVKTYAGVGTVVEVHEYHVILKLDNGHFMPMGIAALLVREEAI